MTAVVLDASVAIKVVLDEVYSPEAAALVADTVRMHAALRAPVILAAEVTNAIYQKERRRLLTSLEADRALRAFLSIPIDLVEDEGLCELALACARRNHLRAVYDGLYLALTEVTGGELWTADLKLVRSLGRAARRVRWIGDYAPA